MVGVDLGEPGVMTSRIGHTYQQTTCCSRQRITELGGAWSAMPPCLHWSATRAPTVDVHVMPTPPGSLLVAK